MKQIFTLVAVFMIFCAQAADLWRTFNQKEPLEI